MMETVSEMETSADFPLVGPEEGEVEDGELPDDGEDDHISNSEEAKLSLRAKRFGLDSSGTRKYKNPHLEKFHRSMGVGSETRTEALHLLGTDNMKTIDVFAYFSGFSPASIEWISDKSCNVVWLDEESCANALKNRSIKIRGLNVENDDPDDSEESISLEDIRCALPPGIWRKGQANSLAPQLFMRYATFTDKKGMIPQHIRFFGNGTFNRNKFLDEGDEVAKKFKLDDSGNPWADIARQWRHFETRVSSAPVRDAREMLSGPPRGKHRLLFPSEPLHLQPPLLPPPPAVVKEEPPSYQPKLDLFSTRKMHADIEEQKILERNRLRARRLRGGGPRGEIDLRERLGRKRKRHEADDAVESGDSDFSPEEGAEIIGSRPWLTGSALREKEDLSLRIEIDNSRDESDHNRDDSSSEESSDEERRSRNSSEEAEGREGARRSDLRSRLQKRKKKKSCRHKKSEEEAPPVVIKSVLRTKYTGLEPTSRPDFEPLRIQIDNDNYKKSSSSSSSSSESESD